jgi:hypothetical protein
VSQAAAALLLLALAAPGARPVRPTSTWTAPAQRPTITPLQGCSRPGASYAIRAGAAGGDGSAQRPFGSIAEGLRAAEAARACRVDLLVAPGPYQGDLQVTRPTAIAGTTDAQAATPIIEGAIRNGSGHPLSLRDLRIAGAVGVGLAQVGGRLDLADVRIVGTRAVAGQPATGTALLLGGGVRAHLTSVVLSSNEARALWAEGVGTVVSLSDVLVERNRALAALAGPGGELVAAVEVFGGARLFADKAVIRDNQAIGVHLRGSARAHLRNVQVAGTTEVPLDGRPGWGIDVMVSDGAVLELRGFLVRTAALTGLHVQDAFLTAEDGSVEDCTVGLHVSAKYAMGYDWASCVPDSVRFLRNRTRVGGLAVPLPGAAPGAPGPSTSSTCLRVPWE